ncbi:N-acetylglucosamine-6-phosphate deacetylase [Alkalicoccus urumqiensis]|uniref:N-acetylglucosamine-6-phosphate deacetylase n=1 Tax=Alkalicoccus urumqiensis TaxID=1548213 RepID=A0A2P6MLM8_ALKUR|nr:N-acetylglucosamine-6-phosphate deacetylase [Alkalicoccus urumqiensis]PRO67195.1 N-acetylglucosamine-6-phosphate deacetylase [Alkalicoccus urumqiensis]
MTSFSYTGCRMLTADGWVESPEITVESGRITRITSGGHGRSSRCIVPGFIDTHIHGAAGSDVMDPSDDALHSIAGALPQEGTTSFLATTITSPEKEILDALRRVKAYKPGQGAAMLGVHLEGPFIHPARKGAQPEAHIQTPDPEVFQQMQEASGGRIRMMTMAPELDEAGLVEKASAEGVVVSMGHTDATAEASREGFRRGVRQATHFFNGMRGLHHREIGVVGAVFRDPDVQVELIADGIHVSPEACALTYELLGADRITLITDAMRAKGLKDGTYTLGGQEVTVTGRTAVLADGTLAGSVLPMAEAVSNIQAFTGCSLEEAVQMASTNPARILGIDSQKGTLGPGMDADWTILDESGAVVETVSCGNVVFSRGGEER